MKILFIGGTGTISTAASKLLADSGHELYVLNRGNKKGVLPDSVKHLAADITDENAVKKLISGVHFDTVADFIAFKPEQIERDHRLFAGKTDQFVFISSASAYQKPLSHCVITESTPLANPFWEYSRNKIACEELLMKLYREQQFPVTIVRPSHTYCERSVPLGVHGANGSWQVIKRLMAGKPVIMHGDGSSLWTLTHADDFATGFCGLLGNAHAIGEAVHITSDESLTWNQIYGCVSRALGVTPVFCYIPSETLAKTALYDFTGSLLGDKAHTVIFDNSKIKRLVPDFCARIRFDQGVRNTIAHVLAHPELQKDDPEFDSWCDSAVACMAQTEAALTKLSVPNSGGAK